MLDVLIKNANIIDGTGKPAYKGSIGISSLPKHGDYIWINNFAGFGVNIKDLC